MKILKSVFAGSAIVLFSLHALAEGSLADFLTVDTKEQIEQCMKECIDSHQPGQRREFCMANCVPLFVGPAAEESENPVQQALESLVGFCETYEEDCERQDDGPWGGL